MKIIKKSLLKKVTDKSLLNLGRLSIKLADSSQSKCCFAGALYETKYPKDLL